MKRISRLTLATALFVSCCLAASAQQFGYINSQELISIMPERASVETQLTAYSTELQEQLEAIQVEFNNKLNDYQNASSSMSDSVRALKEKELQDLQSRFQEFQSIAQQDLQKKQNELMQPILAKASEVVDKVSKSKNLVATFDLAAGAIIYQDTTAMVNILPMAKAELGIK